MFLFVFFLCFVRFYFSFYIFCFFFFKQKTAYEMRISDWSSDVCSSDLLSLRIRPLVMQAAQHAVLRYRDIALRHRKIQSGLAEPRPVPGFEKTAALIGEYARRDHHAFGQRTR